MKKRSFVGEMEWAFNQALCCNNDRNPNRAAQVDAALRYGLDVVVARRCKLQLPVRPDLSKVI